MKKLKRMTGWDGSILPPMSRSRWAQEKREMRVERRTPTSATDRAERRKAWKLHVKDFPPSSIRRTGGVPPTWAELQARRLCICGCGCPVAVQA